MTITIHNLHQHTGEQVYNHIVAHLLSMKVRSYDNNTGCMYRSPTGNMCAAGCLIPDDDYIRTMERKPWDALANRGRVPMEHDALIRQLQMVHDEGDHWDDDGLNDAGKASLEVIKDRFMGRPDWNNLPE